MHQHEPTNKSSANPFSIESLIGDGILWAVPKKRVSLEKRMKKKFGIKGLNIKWKIFEPKVTLRQCSQCGCDHEIGVLCGKQLLTKWLKTNNSTFYTIDSIG